MRRTLLALIAALALLSGCAGEKQDGDDVATAGGATPNASASDGSGNSGDVAEQMAKYASCMRENGIDMPDPEVDEGGGVRFRAPAGAAEGERPDQQKLQAAQEKCKQYLPNGGEPPKMSAEELEKARQFSQCMRDNGVPEFPDPQPDGGMRLEAGPGTGIDPDSQEFKDAQAKCEQYRPRRGDEKTNNGGGS